MRDEHASAPHLESLKKQAKRWLKAIRAGDPDSIARFRRANPEAPSSPILRDVQHALARERGFDGWRSLTASGAIPPPHAPQPSREEAISALLAAADKGDAAQVGALLDAHPDIANERGLLPGHSGMRTALHFATSGPHEAVIELLLEEGADPNIRCEGDWAFPLHFVAEKGRLDLVRLLIEHGADPIGTGDYHELEVIGWATAFDDVKPRPDLVEYLLAHGARHTIFSAVATGDIGAIRAIAAASPADLERRMDPTNRRRRPVHLAVVKRQQDALTTLLDLGADPNTLDESGLSPLDEAAFGGELALTDLLIRRGAEMTLAAAVVLERGDDIERLIARDPDGLKPGHRWGTLIVRACERSSARVIETLIRYGASVDVRDDPRTAIDSTSGYAPLHAAGFFGNLDAARVLLEHGANVRARDERYEGTPGGWAAFAGHAKVRDLILAGPIDIFDAIEMDRADRLPDILEREPEAREHPFSHYLAATDAVASFVAGIKRLGWYTPLVFAVHGGRLDAARILLDYGANPSIRTPDNRTLTELAQENGHVAVLQLLKDRGV